MVAKSKSAKSAPRASSKKEPKPIPKAAPKTAAKASNQQEWLQDVSIEAPIPSHVSFEPGKRQLEFSVGMRQQELGDHVRSELRARALVHAEDVVLLLIEASYVNIAPKNEIRENLPEYLYSQLKPELEKLMTVTGHNPPLPTSLEKIG